MSADVLLLPLGGRAVDAPDAGTVLVVASGAALWQVTLRGYVWGLRRTMPRYGVTRFVGILDGIAAAEEVAEAHGLGIAWHELGPRSMIATGVFFRD